jgi:hypothetical protein
MYDTDINKLLLIDFDQSKQVDNNEQLLFRYIAGDLYQFITNVLLIVNYIAFNNFTIYDHINHSGILQRFETLPNALQIPNYALPHEYKSVIGIYNTCITDFFNTCELLQKNTDTVQTAIFSRPPFYKQKELSKDKQLERAKLLRTQLQIENGQIRIPRKTSKGTVKSLNNKKSSKSVKSVKSAKSRNQTKINKSGKMEAKSLP